MRLDIVPGKRELRVDGKEYASDWAVVDVDSPVIARWEGKEYHDPVWMEGIGYLHHYESASMAFAMKERYLRELTETVTTA